MYNIISLLTIQKRANDTVLTIINISNNSNVIFVFY